MRRSIESLRKMNAYIESTLFPQSRSLNISLVSSNKFVTVDFSCTKPC